MPERPLYGLFGTGGFGRPVMYTLLEMVRERHGDDADVVFIDDAPASAQVNGTLVVDTDSFLAVPRAMTFFNFALANSRARMARCERVLTADIKPISMI